MYSLLQNSPVSRGRCFLYSISKIVSAVFLSCILLSTTYAQSISDKKVTLQLNQVPLSQVLNSISDQTGFEFSYSGTVIEGDKLVSVSYSATPLNTVLSELTKGASVKIQQKGKRILLLPDKKGSVKGSVKTSDGKPGEFVNVIVSQTGKGAVTDENGDFFIKNVPVGKHTISVQLLGYSPIQSEIAIEADQTVTLATVFLNEDSKVLQEVVVSGNAEGYKTDLPSQSLRIQTPIMETPQNIIVLGKELFKDQQIFTMTDVTRNVSGVTSLYPYVNTYTDFAIRGTRATNNKMRNGVPTTIPYLGIEEDMSYVEKVEFIKGPAGFMLSQGEPGGMYNVVTKKPLHQERQSVDLTTGSYGLYRVSTDITGPIGDKLFYRLNAMGRKSGTHIDFSENNRFSIAPVLRYEFDEKTSFTLEYNGDFILLKGVDPTVSTRNGEFLSRRFAVEDPAIPYTKLNSHYGLASFNHVLSDNWNITAQVSVIKQLSDRKNMTSRAAISSSGMLMRQYRESFAEGNTMVGQVFLNGAFETGILKHKLMLGYDGGKQQANGRNVFIPNVFAINVDNPLYNLSKRSFDTLNIAAATSYSPQASVEWQAVYLQDVISPVSWMQITLAGRYTYYRSGSPKLLTENVFTPRFGLVLTPIPNTTIYAMYDRAFLAQAGQTFNKKDFDPLEGNNIEFGVKREWLGKRLFTQIAYFDITKKNALTADPANVGFSIQQGEVKSKGVEVDVLGSIGRNMCVMANYAYTDVKVTADTDASLVGSRQQTPLHTFNSWLKYTVPSGNLKGLGFGLGYSVYKSRYVLAIKKVASDLNYAKLPNYKSLNGAIYYTTGKLNLALNLDNITNAFNVYGYLDRRNGTNGEFYYMSMPGANFRLCAGYRF